MWQNDACACIILSPLPKLRRVLNAFVLMLSLRCAMIEKFSLDEQMRTGVKSSSVKDRSIERRFTCWRLCPACAALKFVRPERFMFPYLKSQVCLIMQSNVVKEIVTILWHREKVERKVFHRISHWHSCPYIATSIIRTPWLSEHFALALHKCIH